MTIDRRAILTSGLIGPALLAASQASAAARPAKPVRPAELIKLWPNGAPGGGGVHVTQKTEIETEFGHTGHWMSNVTDPALTIHKAKGRSDTAILVIPGGGFTSVMFDKEGEEICAWLNANGISAGSLLYRLPADGWTAREDAPLQDAKRALQLLAKATGARRIGVMGFSAGGTIAAGLATRYEEPLYPVVDDADHVDAKPSFMALGYPYLNLPPPAGFGSMFHGMTAKSPPAFFFLAADDKRVSIDNSTTNFARLCELKVPAALHVFENGAHGFALRAPKASSAARWPELFLTWARTGGHIT